MAAGQHGERPVANDPNQNGGLPRISGQRRHRNGASPPDGLRAAGQPRIYYGRVIAHADDYAIVGAERCPAASTTPRPTRNKNYTYNGRGGVPIGNLFNRLVFAAKYAERNSCSPPDRRRHEDHVQPGPVATG